MQQTIFYSWQSDLPNSSNRGLIQDCLENVVKEIKNDEVLTIYPLLERDTAGVAGSPDIGQTILSKIDQSLLFVCDISIISESAAKRSVPNPNVLLELGYALSKLGDRRIIMIMNTFFGGPELLPFDLRQKRVVTYTLSEKEEKTNVKKILQDRLGLAIKAILVEQMALNLNVIVKTSSPAEVVMEAIKTNRQDKTRAIHDYMKWLGDQLKKIDSENTIPEPDEKLVESIKQTIAPVKTFDDIANEIAKMNDSEAAEILFKDFEYILPLYYLPQGFSGSYNTTDFDLFKFIGHELFTILFGYLVKDNRWILIGNLLQNKIYIPNGPNGAATVSYISLSSYIVLLNEVRKQRLKLNRTSVHADILKERHEKGLLSENLTWTEFMNADLFLYFYSVANNESNMYNWWPRTAVYLGWGNPLPRFLVETTSVKGAESLAKALNLKDKKDLPEVIEKAIATLSRGMNQLSIFAEPLSEFDVKNILIS